VENARKIKLIALDLDGTLFGPAGRVTPRTAEAVHRVRESGVAVCIATGRTWFESTHAVEACGLDGPGVFVSGAVVRDMKSGTPLARTTVPDALVQGVCRRVEALGLPAMVLHDDAPGQAEFAVSANVALPDVLKQWFEIHKSDVEFIPDLAGRSWTHAVRVGTVAVPEAVESIGEALDRGELGEASHHCIHVPSYGVNVLEVFHAGVNKWEGILEVCRRLNIDPTQTAAVGDDVNDLAMLERAGFGVAMGNATPRPKQIAKRILDTNARDGLAAFLEELLETDFSIPPA
jgi:Cof subfamily protein (haloacid dehalogenase superfamily)